MKKMIQLSAAAVLVALGLVLTSCGGGTTTPTTTPSTGTTTPVTAPVTPAVPVLDTVVPVKGTEMFAPVVVMANDAPLGYKVNNVDTRVGKECWPAIATATDFTVKFSKYGDNLVATLWTGSGARLNCNGSTLIIPALKEGKLVK